MNILIIGSGGREHALAWKISQSPLVDEVWSAPGNPGMNAIGPCFDVSPTDIGAVEKLVLQIEPDLIVIGPEQPLADGLADELRARGFDVFGPSARAARIEASKGYSKDLMARYRIPTAGYSRVSEPSAASDYLDRLKAPFVIKADGLAGGKGVVIAPNRSDADEAVSQMLDGQFGPASNSLVIEEFMDGEEVSVFVLTDGQNAVILPGAQDHKKVGEGDTGPNTGGMGAYAPAPILTDALLDDIKGRIVMPTLRGMANDGTPFQGVLYVGLMITQDGPKVVEYNCRFGDPETQVLMAGIEGDIVPLMLACATGGLSQKDFDGLADGMGGFKPAATVVLASKGYPGSYEKGSSIKGIKQAEAIDGVTVFHAGTDVGEGGSFIATGGRVLNVTGTGETLEEAFKKAYAGVAAIDWPEGFHRRDIGWRVR